MPMDDRETLLSTEWYGRYLIDASSNSEPSI
jgi:hypothetical protein